MYGVMRPWVQGQPWYMRVKIGLYCTDDLISIFRDLGMEMTLFTFKCFVLAPGLLYLCLIPVRRQKCTESDWELASWIATIHCKHSKVYTLQPPGRVHKERAFDSFQESPSSFSFQPTWCMHSRKYSRSRFQKGSVFRDNLEDVWHLAFHSTSVMASWKRSWFP